MLVLSRKVDESIVIGKDISITVVEICRHKVRLGFIAPGIAIYREEVAPADREDGTAAGKGGHGMLILSRKVGESVLIGDNIRVVVLAIYYGRIRLGIDAPRDVPIYRQELLPLKNGDQPPPSNSAQPQ